MDHEDGQTGTLREGFQDREYAPAEGQRSPRAFGFVFSLDCLCTRSPPHDYLLYIGHNMDVRRRISECYRLGKAPSAKVI